MGGWSTAILPLGQIPTSKVILQWREGVNLVDSPANTVVNSSHLQTAAPRKTGKYIKLPYFDTKLNLVTSTTTYFA